MVKDGSMYLTLRCFVWLEVEMMTHVEVCCQMAWALIKNPEWASEQEELRYSKRQRMSRVHSWWWHHFIASVGLVLSGMPLPKLSMVNSLVWSSISKVDLQGAFGRLFKGNFGALVGDTCFSLFLQNLIVLRVLSALSTLKNTYKWYIIG